MNVSKENSSVEDALGAPFAALFAAGTVASPKGRLDIVVAVEAVEDVEQWQQETTKPS